jgi:hypothetical protein
MTGVDPEGQRSPPPSRIAIMLAILAAVVLLFPRRPPAP